jgi:hypothetical protein
MNRKSGYYWVKMKDKEVWYISLYTQFDGMWSFFHTEHQYTDELLLEIDENVLSRK